MPVLQYESLDTFGMSRGESKPDRRPEIEHVQAEAVEARGVRERLDHISETIEGRPALERRAPAEARVVRRDDVIADLQPFHQRLILR
jgi:hypothetical protein